MFVLQAVALIWGSGVGLSLDKHQNSQVQLDISGLGTSIFIPVRSEKRLDFYQYIKLNVLKKIILEELDNVFWFWSKKEEVTKYLTKFCASII